MWADLRGFIWPVRGPRSYAFHPCHKPYLTHNSFNKWRPSIPRSSSLTCHKPRPDPHSHSSTLPCDSAHHDGPHTHSSTKDRPAPGSYWVASSWWQLIQKGSEGHRSPLGKQGKSSNEFWTLFTHYSFIHYTSFILLPTFALMAQISDLERFIHSWTMQPQPSNQTMNQEPKKAHGSIPTDKILLLPLLTWARYLTLNFLL